MFYKLLFRWNNSYCTMHYKKSLVQNQNQREWNMPCMDSKKRRTFVICGMLKDEFQMIYQNILETNGSFRTKKAGLNGFIQKSIKVKHTIQVGQEQYEDRLVFFPRSLHKNPAYLHQKLQDAINLEKQSDEIILLYGFCGRATQGLYSMNARLLLPKFDDCIQMLSYEANRTQRSLLQKDHLYVTKGWCQDRESILETCKEVKKTYKKEEAKEILDCMYGAYKTITILDTKAYDVTKIKAAMVPCSKELDMNLEIKKSSLKIMKNLILGNYKEEIIIKEPKNQVCAKDYEWD